MRRVTADGWSVSCTTGGPEGGAIASCRKHRGHLIHGIMQRGELDGVRFTSSSEAFAAMHARGYTQIAYRRHSTPLLVFAGLRHHQDACRFDALYRLWKWKRRNSLDLYALELKLMKLAKRVSIFHPVTKQFRD